MQSCLYSSRLGKPLLKRSSGSSTTSFIQATEQISPYFCRYKHDVPSIQDRISRIHKAQAGWRTRILASEFEQKELRGKEGILPSWGQGQSRSASDFVGVATVSLDSSTPSRSKIKPSRNGTWTIRTVLARYLDLQDASERKDYWNGIKHQLRPNVLPHILLQYMHRSSAADSQDEFERLFCNRALSALHCRNLKMDDVMEWASILSGDGADDMILRFFSSTSEKPHFLLLEILRRDILKVRTLKLVLAYVWNHVLGRQQKNATTTSESDIYAVIPRSEVAYMPSILWEPLSKPSQMENSFTLMISRLLYQTRRIWPPAMVSVSHMLSPYIHSLLASKSCRPKELDSHTLKRLCKLNNHVLHLLALPASIDPMKSMVHNWTSQRVLLELAGNFEPPLSLDQKSYRAVIQVLAASRKTERESRVAIHRTRSWPPWRVDQDGMDAQRSLEDDFSRTTSAATRMKESGYRENQHDHTMKIFGGQEPDGTPTIQSRKLVKLRTKRNEKSTDNIIYSNFDPHVWAARVEATRDVQEAWAAFTGLQERGGKPNLAVYLAMFQKINYESARLGRKSPHEAPPGDGKEVWPVSNDNFSEYYRLSLQAPPIDELYNQMTKSGLRPSGRCLLFLIRHARTTDQGIRYLYDSELDNTAVTYLAGGSESKISPMVLRKIPDPVFTAFLSLVCRFAPRAICSYFLPDSAPSTSTGYSSNDVGEESKAMAMAEPASKIWSVIEMQPRKLKHPRFKNPLHHAAFLLKQRQTRFRPAWYALFRALSRPRVIISRALVGDPENEHRAWRVLVMALEDFHNCGAELDPFGFQLICHGFEKFALAYSNCEENRDVISEGAKLVKAEFLNLSEIEEAGHGIPQLLHSISGSHLHAYVRALGAVGDYDGILSVLDWMVENERELQATASEARNGPKLIMRTVIAIRVFLKGTKYENRARELASAVDWWGGWPQDTDVQEYIERRSIGSVNYEDVGIVGNNGK